METLQRTANRGSVAPAVAYEIDNSLKFEPDNSEYIYRTPSSAGNRKTWTLSFWIKRTELADGSNTMRVFEAWDGSTGTSGLFTAGDAFILDLNAGSNYFTSSALFRDTSAWSHFVIRVDTTSGTASERARVYVNGSELAGSWNSNIGQNTDLTWNQDVAHNFARFHNNDSFVSGYYAEIINVDGTSLAPTAFGEVDEDSGIWIPIDASPTYGTNGFKLEFKTAGGLGADTSGNGHTWSLNAIAAADQATDTPTNNFCIMNVLNGTSSDIATTQGGTKVANSGSSMCSMNGSIGVSSGKWYWECRFANDPGNTNTVFVGIAAANDPYVPHTNNYLGQQSGYGSIGWYFVNGGIYNGTGTWAGPGYGNIIMFALDMDNLKLYFGKEGTWQNSSDPAGNSNGISIATSFTNLTGGTDIILPSISITGGDNMDSMNFGGFANYTQSSAASDANGYGTFEYAPPSGYYAICTKNLLV